MKLDEQIAAATLKALEGFKRILEFHKIDHSIGTNENSQLIKIQSDLISDIRMIARDVSKPEEDELT